MMLDINLNSLISGAIGSLFGAIGGGVIVLVASIITQNRHWRNQQKREEEKRLLKTKQIQSAFFMELNYNKRKIIYTIENESYRLTGLDNLHWKVFIYSEASHILMTDKELIDDLATLDSMIDQANNIIHYIKESETARICTIGKSISGSGTTEKLRTSLRQYAIDKLKPQIDKVIPKLEDLFKNS